MVMSQKLFLSLTDSIDWSEKQLLFPREKRVSAVQEMCGYHYMEGGANHIVPVNMDKLAVDIYVRQLAARAPRVLITTVDPKMRPVAANLELALNLIPDQIKLADTLRRVVTEALFAFGIVKIGLHSAGDLIGRSAGETFVDVVTLDDYFLDMTAKHIDTIQYEGNDYWLTFEEIMESDLFPKKLKADLQHDDDTDMGEHGETKAGSISRSGTATSYKKRVWLRDVWIPGDGVVITYAVKEKRLLRDTDWEGAECGPYVKLGFSDVPGNLLPLPPMAVWRDLHDLSNALFRKMAKQADGQKSALGFGGSNDESAQNFQGAKDGEGVHYTGPKPERLEAGGVSPNTLAFYLQCKELFSYFGGNIDALGGLAPMTETVGQDKLLTESAGAQMRAMAGSTIDFVKEIFKQLAFYEWNDPVSERMLDKPIPGTDMTIPVRWNADSKQGDFDSLNLDIDVYSLQDDSPSQKLQRLGFIMQTYIAPLLPEIQRQGGQVDAAAIIRMVAKYADFPELSEIVTFIDQAAAPPQGGAPPSRSASGPPQRQQSGPPSRSGGSSDLLNQLLQGQGQEGA